MKASVFLARYLRSQGLQRAFGLPGGESVPLMEGLRQVDIPFVLAHHESAAGYAAATTWTSYRCTWPLHHHARPWSR